MQFFMHLNDEYEAIRGQILLLDPLPTVNKAYSMIQRVERQRHVTNSTTGTFLNQRKYIMDILTDAGLTVAKPTKFPMAKGLKLSSEAGELLVDPAVYRRIIRRLLSLTLTRPDISYVVQHLSQFLQAPKKPHCDAALHVLRYLKGTIHKGPFYP